MKIYHVVFFLLFAFAATGCIYNRAPIVVATQTQTQLQIRRDAEEKYWLGLLKQRRTEFEQQLDAFVVGSQRDAEDASILTASAVAKIQYEESVLRDEFDKNEKASLADISENIKWYDDLIMLQQKIIESDLQLEEARARAIDRITKELERYSKTLADNANNRRAKLAENPDPVPMVSPSTSGVAVVKTR